MDDAIKAIGPENYSRVRTNGVYVAIVFIVALAYGAILASLPLEAFKDRDNYLAYATWSGDLLTRYWSTSPLVAFANEPIWLVINDWLASVLSPENTVRAIIFVPATMLAWVVLREQPRHFVWLLLFLFLPQVVKNHVIHLRQGVAIAIFLCGWFTRRPALRYLLLATTPLIHAAFFIVLGLLALTQFGRWIRLSGHLRTSLALGAGVAAVIGLAQAASVLGARQASTYAFTASEISGLGFFFWFSVLVVMCMQGRSFIREHAFELATIVFYLCTYFFIEVSARIFESTLMLVLLAGLHLTHWRRAAFLALVMTYGLVWYILRVDQVWFGFGLE